MDDLPAPSHLPPEPHGWRERLRGRWRALSRLPLSMMTASVLLGLGIVQLSFHLGHLVYRSATWQQETRDTLARAHGLQRDVNILREAQRAANDPAYLEQLARCQGFVGGRETVVVATNAPAEPGQLCETVRLP